MTKITDRGELIELVRRIMDADGTEEEVHEMIFTLEESVLDPNVSNLIYYPPGGVELTPEEIVEQALKYKAIQL